VNWFRGNFAAWSYRKRNSTYYGIMY